MSARNPLQKPEASSGFAQKELDKAEKQFEAFDENCKSLTQDRMQMAPRVEEEPQTKMSTAQQQKSADIYLKPIKRISSREKFNERFQEAWEYDKQYVKVMAEHKEIVGEGIDLWTKPYPGIPAEEWNVPTGKPVWMPRYLAEQLKRKYYHRLVMQQTTTNQDGMGQYYGQLAADTTIQRLDCHAVSDKKPLFMGSKTF